MNQQQINFRDRPLAEEMRPHFLKYNHDRLAKLREAMGAAIGNGDTTTAISLLSMMRRYGR